MDEEIIKLSNKKNPNFLFIDHAMRFSESIQESYYETMRKIYNDKYGCLCKHLKASELSNIKLAKEMVD